MARYIDADDAIYELERAFPIDDFGKIVRCISRTPTADVMEKKRGKWIIEKEIVDGVLHSRQFCSNCDYPQYLTTNFCPKCGAAMQEREGE